MENSNLRPAPAATKRGFLARLRDDRGGNTLAMMAAFLFPVCGLAGSAVDMARLYVVKVRLQQACDAGVLAGRKFMTSSSNPTLDATATTQAKLFFANNFPSGWMGTPAFDSTKSPYPFIPTKTTDQQVAGTATTTVPMTVMKMFGSSDQTITVTCEARFDVADTDIIFVLDTTGSMACPPEMSNSNCSTYVGNNPAQAYTRPSSDPDAVAGYGGTTAYGVPETTAATGSRIKALRQAVKDFYDTMAANIDPTTNIRYGFVTYTSTVNAGKAIYSKSPQYLVGGNSGEKWKYQSRYVSADYVKSAGTWTDVSKTKSDCETLAATPTRTPSTALTYNPSTSTATLVSYRWNTSNSPNKCQTKTDTLGPRYTHTQVDWDVSAYVAGNEVIDPSKVDGSTSRWDGCIEERATQAGVTTFTSASKDLDPDLIPTTSDATTRWKPMWADTIYARNNANSTADDVSNGDASDAPNLSSTNYLKSGYVTCGKPVHRLSTMTKDQIAAYVDAPDFKPIGGTYHDTGMIWGVRMLSPNGIFASDTSAWPGRQAPKRIIVFLTDGNMAPNQIIYGLYGIEYYDRRVSGGNFSSLTDYHNARFVAECRKAQALGIDVWTVAIGMDTTTELTNCASSPSQALDTTTGTGLSDAFKQIAKQVAMLRISQ